MRKKKARKQNGAFSAFLRDIVRSCYDLERYRAIRTAPVGGAVRYFFALTLVMTALVTATAVPGAIRTYTALRDDVLGTLPGEVTLRIVDGRFSTDIPVPSEYTVEGIIMRIDPGVQGTDPDPNVFGAATVVLGSDAIFLSHEGSEPQVYGLADTEDVTMTITEARAWLRANGPLLLSLTFGAFGLGYLIAIVVGTGLFALLAAFLAWAVGRAWKMHMSYAAWVAVALHAITLPLAVDILFGTFLTPVPFVFTVIFSMILVAVAIDERSLPAIE